LLLFTTVKKGWTLTLTLTHAIVEVAKALGGSFELVTLVPTRSSADADNGLDAFVGQSRSTNISGPFQVK